MAEPDRVCFLCSSEWVITEKAFIESLIDLSLFFDFPKGEVLAWLCPKCFEKLSDKKCMRKYLYIRRVEK